MASGVKKRKGKILREDGLYFLHIMTIASELSPGDDDI